MAYDNKEIGDKYENMVEELLEWLGWEITESTGTNGEPDIIAETFDPLTHLWEDNHFKFGIEVKALRPLVSKDATSWQVGQIKQEQGAWERFSNYCEENGLKRAFIVVIYSEGMKPIPFCVDPKFIDERVENTETARISLWQLLRNELVTDPSKYCRRRI